SRRKRQAAGPRPAGWRRIFSKIKAPLASFFVASYRPIALGLWAWPVQVLGGIASEKPPPTLHPESTAPESTTKRTKSHPAGPVALLFLWKIPFRGGCAGRPLSGGGGVGRPAQSAADGLTACLINGQPRQRFLWRLSAPAQSGGLKRRG